MADTKALPWPEGPTLRVKMLSDWHVGSGMGRPGSIDRLVARDEDGLPYIPAKTLTGIWRDAAERLAMGLDGKDSGKWSEWVKHLFGDQPVRGETDPSRQPRPSVVSVRAAHLVDSLRDRLRLPVALRGLDERQLSGAPEGQRQEIEHLKQRTRTLQAALTFVKPGVKIDRRNGRALDDHLRFEEMARVGAILTAAVAVRLPDQPAQQNAAIALLVASAQLVERLGGKRRRGAGRCKLSIDQTSVAETTAWLEANEQPPDIPVPPNETGAGCLVGANSTQASDWVTIPYILELGRPVAVSSRTRGNVVESLDFVPGTFLLPHFTAAFETLGVANVRQAIIHGDLRVLPATIEVGDEPGRPVSYAIFRRKEGGSLAKPETLVNCLLSPDADDKEQQLVQCRSGYLGATSRDAMPDHKSVAMTLRTHNTVDEDKQRPTTDVGGVYSYEAIATRRLRGELRMRRSLFDTVARNQAWKAKLGGACRLGRSKKDDYGEVELKITGDPTAMGASRPCVGGKLLVWVLTDVLLRDERLRPAPSPRALRLELERLLGVALAEEPGVTRFGRVRRIESWHVGWCLPRPSLVALQAGTSLVFSLPANLDAAKRDAVQKTLSEIEAQGLGERTAEGYGQLCFNDPLLLSPLGGRKPATPEPPAQATVIGPLLSTDADAANTFAQRIEREVWRESIHRAALPIAHDEKRRRELLGWYGDHPPMSQLGGLRGVVQQLTSWESRTVVLQWLAHLAETRCRAAKWDGALEKVRAIFESRDAIWAELNPHDWPTLTQEATTTLRDSLWPLAVRTLIGAAIRAHKRALDANERRG